MRNLALVDAVVALHEIAHTVLEEVGDCNLHDDLRNCAHRLHLLSIQDNKNSVTAQDIINKAKE
jgi:hypothetical protein